MASIRSRRSAIPLVATVTALVLTGCGLVTSLTSRDSESPSSTGTGTGAITSLDNARAATVRIVAEGSYADPAEGLVSSAGSGSGFIIDPSGIAVTNAHVVEGAGSLRVFVDGSKDYVNARILGVSECDDLAVIDLEGDGYAYLGWYDGPADPGLPVYAAGYPLGDPEYTLVQGIVAKARASGDTPWSSIDYTLQHDAQIQPGNSGGPLLTEDATVVGVVYASADETNTSQFFALPAAIARPAADALGEGVNVDSIGVNGVAIWDDTANQGGVWVSSVRAGSPASNAGIEPGDLILALAGREVVKASDAATKRGYCDVIRTQGADSPMAVVVYRPDTSEVLRGEINNPRKKLTAVPLPQNGGTTGSTGTADYTTVTDDTGRLTTQMPVAWSDVVKESVTTDVGRASYLSGSPDQDNFLEGRYSAPGILYLVHTDVTGKDLVRVRDAYARMLGLGKVCTPGDSTDKVTEYADYSYVDANYSDCGKGGQNAYVAAIWHPDAAAMVIAAGAWKTDEELALLNATLVSADVT